MKNNQYAFRLTRLSDLFLPLSLLIASLLGRSSAALMLFFALYITKLCALAASDGLRGAFACQPSIRYVQGSAIVALLSQIPGAAISALILHAIPGAKFLLPLIPCGTLLNIEHVFYEYLCATGDKNSATFSRCITAVLALLGLVLSMPPERGGIGLTAVDPAWLTITCGLSALIGLFLCLCLGGSLHPVLNTEVLRRAPLSMLQAGLCPALTLVVLTLLWPASFHPTLVFAGLMLYEACRTPFRRTPMESSSMNRFLFIVSAASILCGAVTRFLIKGSFSDTISMTCAALLISAICAFALFGNVDRRRD